VKRTQKREIKTELRQSRAYRNPSFLQKMVEHSGIKEFGSNLPKEVFDPDNLHEEVPYSHQLQDAMQWELSLGHHLPSNANIYPASYVRQQHEILLSKA
jgi:HCNGP-like protein